MTWLTPKRDGAGPAVAATELVGVRTIIAAAMALADAAAAVRACGSAAMADGTDRCERGRSTENAAPRDQPPPPPLKPVAQLANASSRKAIDGTMGQRSNRRWAQAQ